MTEKYSSLSVYYKTPQTTWYLGMYNHTPVARYGTDILYTIPVEYHKRPDLCAYKLYGNPRYKTIFATMNMNIIKNLIDDFVTGTEIYIPTVEKIKRIYG